MKRLLTAGLLVAGLGLTACGGTGGPCVMDDGERLCGHTAVAACTGRLEGEQWIKDNLGGVVSENVREMSEKCDRVLAEAR
jgi:hypothetical protein